MDLKSSIQQAKQKRLQREMSDFKTWARIRVNQLIEFISPELLQVLQVRFYLTPRFHERIAFHYEGIKFILFFDNDQWTLKKAPYVSTGQLYRLLDHEDLIASIEAELSQSASPDIPPYDWVFPTPEDAAGGLHIKRLYYAAILQGAIAAGWHNAVQQAKEMAELAFENQPDIPLPPQPNITSFSIDDVLEFPAAIPETLTGSRSARASSRSNPQLPNFTDFIV